MNNIHISFFEPEQWQEYKNIRLKALKEEPTAFASSYEESFLLSDDEWIKKMKEYSDAGNVLLFAENNGNMIGMTGVEFESAQKTKHVAHIWGVYVDPSSRGKGVAKQLFSTLMEYLEKKSGITKVKLGVNLKQTAAVALYEKFGFKKVGVEEKETYVDGQYQDLYLMEKLLQ